MKLETICLDMDGVLNEFVGPAVLAHGRADLADARLWPKGIYMPEAVLGVSSEEFWRPIDHLGADWWAELPPYWWLADLLQHAASLARDVMLLTKPHTTAECVAGKLRWVQRHCPKQLRSLCMTADKWRLAKPRRLLIDDCEDNVRDWRNAGGVALLFPQPWNAGHGNVFTVMEEMNSMLRA